MSKLEESRLRIDAFRYSKISAALQIPIRFQKMPSTTAGALVKNRIVYLDRDLDYKVQLVVFCHELLHFLLKHIERGQGKHPELWGIVIDHVVNSMITDTLKIVPREWVYEQGFILLNPFLPKGPAEVLYRMLLKRVNEEKRKGTSSFEFGGLTINLNPISVKGAKTTQHNLDESLDLSSGSLSEFERGLKSAGNISSQVLREVTSGYKSQVSWEKILVSRITSYVGKKISSPTYTRIPYYQLGITSRSQVRLPAMYKKAFSLVLAFDTSGSISDYELSRFCSEFEVVNKLITESWVYIIDSEIKYTLHNPDFSTLASKLVGGGGTSFKPVFEDVERRKIKPNLLVYFTDTFGEFPKKPPQYPVMWLVVRDFQTESVKVPFGTVYYID